MVFCLTCVLFFNSLKWRVFFDKDDFERVSCDGLLRTTGCSNETTAHQDPKRGHRFACNTSTWITWYESHTHQAEPSNQTTSNVKCEKHAGIFNCIEKPRQRLFKDLRWKQSWWLSSIWQQHVSHWPQATFRFNNINKKQQRICCAIAQDILIEYTSFEHQPRQTSNANELSRTAK